MPCHYELHRFSGFFLVLCLHWHLLVRFFFCNACVRAWPRLMPFVWYCSPGSQDISPSLRYKSKSSHIFFFFSIVDVPWCILNKIYIFVSDILSFVTIVVDKNNKKKNSNKDSRYHDHGKLFGNAFSICWLQLPLQLQEYHFGKFGFFGTFLPFHFENIVIQFVCGGKGIHFKIPSPACPLLWGNEYLLRFLCVRYALYAAAAAIWAWAEVFIHSHKSRSRTKVLICKIKSYLRCNQHKHCCTRIAFSGRLGGGMVWEVWLKCVLRWFLR